MSIEQMIFFSHPRSFNQTAVFLRFSKEERPLSRVAQLDPEDGRVWVLLFSTLRISLWHLVHVGITLNPRTLGESCFFFGFPIIKGGALAQEILA